MRAKADASASLRGQSSFWALWSAATVSGFGDYVTLVALRILVVQTLHEGAGAVGLLSAARWLPYLAFGLVAGVLVERARRRPLLIASDLGRAALLVTIPALATAGHLNLGVLAVVMGVYGLLSLANDAASVSFLPRLLGPRLLAPAIAPLDQSDAVAMTSGPALAGALITVFSAPAAILADAVSFLTSGLLLLKVRVAEPAAQRVSLRGIPAEAREGLRFVYRHPVLAPYALASHTWFVFNAVCGTVALPFALETLHLSPFGVGVALAAAGVGSLLGSLAAVRLGRAIGVGWIDIVCYSSNGLAWGLIALSAPHLSGWLLFGLGQLLFGVGLGIENANGSGYRQAATPDRLQARMGTTIRSINRAMIVIGAPVGGLIADAIGYRVVLLGSGAGFVIIALALIPTPFRRARFGDRFTGDA